MSSSAGGKPVACKNENFPCPCCITGWLGLHNGVEMGSVHSTCTAL